jgi:hypothetical protein
MRAAGQEQERREFVEKTDQVWLTENRVFPDRLLERTSSQILP